MESFHPKRRKMQAARCMDCGTPFCQTATGCPVHNLIPEWNDLIYHDQWKEANARLHKTNNFPEFTGRVCPAPCEGACVAGAVTEAVTIKNIERSIVDRAFNEGWIVPRLPKRRTKLRVGIIGSGPAGLAAADELNQLGHTVTVYEKDDKIGGLLMYGIPNMKLDKALVQRRVHLLEEEGIIFYTDAEVGKDVDMDTLKQNHEAIIICTGSTIPRDLKIPGREVQGIHFAMEFLKGNQKRLLFASDGGLQSNWAREYVSAEGKDIVIIGGGDTGTDCIATSLRHRCRSIITLEHKAQPPLTRAPSNPWPEYPRVYGVDYGHAEYRSVYGKDPRLYEKSTKEFIGDENGHIKAIVTLDTMRNKETGKLEVIPGSERSYPCDLAILAMGFVGPNQHLSDLLSLEKDARGNILAPYGNFRTSTPGIFAAGDCRRGQSLVVWAINEGRYVAAAVEKYFIETGCIEKVSSAQAYT